MNPARATHSFVQGPAFWADFARLLLQRQPVQLVLVPGYAHAKLLRAALGKELKARSCAVMRLPAMLTPADWLRSLNPGQSDIDLQRDLQRRVELFEALRQTDWLAQAMSGGGGEGSGLWSLTRQLLSLGDELSWAAWLKWGGEHIADADQIEQQLRALIRSNYATAAWQACSPEAELVLGLWRARFSNQSDTPPMLQVVRAIDQTPPDGLVLALMPQWYAPHEQALLARHARRAPVEYVVVDVAASLPPTLAQAWPEVLNDEGLSHEWPDLRARAQSLRSQAQPLTQFALLATHSLEEEAVAAASHVLDWLREGRSAIGVVVLDRVVARRVRALLERAEVLVQDETGWKLSTSSAAGMLMRWLQLCSARAACETSVLLDWLKSPFVWAGVADKAALLACIETAIRRHQVARGWDAILAALRGPDACHARARSLLEQVRQHSQPARGRQTLARHFAWLEVSLNQSLTQNDNPVRSALQADTVGRSLLQLLDQLAADVQQQSGRYSLAEWRDLLADALENTTFRDQSIVSPVLFCTLPAARLRHFDGLLIVGADAHNFALAQADALFLTPGLRAELGLRHRDAEAYEQLLDLALLLGPLLAPARPNVITWQAQVQGEGNPLAPPLERFALLHRLAFGDDLRRTFDWASAHCTQTTRTQTHPAPAPAAPLLVPERLSASAYERLITCPYRYFVQSMLGWTPLDEVSEEAEKRHYGELLHRILQAFHEQLKSELKRQPDPPEVTRSSTERHTLIAQLQVVSTVHFAPLVQANGDYIAWRERWQALIPSYVDWHLEWHASGWHFAAAEVQARRDLMLVNGRPLSLHGRLDRTDERDVSSTPQRALIDYKAKSKTALKNKLKPVGEDVQLPFYRLLLAEENVSEAFYLSVDKGQVEAVTSEHSLEDLSAALEQRIRSDFSRLHAGAPLPANGINSVCQYCNARGLCRKGHWQVPIEAQS